MKTDATDKGVSQPPEQSQEDPREAIVNSILKKNEEQDKEFEKYMAQGENEETDANPEEKPAAEETDKKPEEPAEEMVKIVVDGEEKEVSLSQIVDAGKRTLQKSSAADKRLEEATRLLNEAKKTQKPPVKPDADKQAENKFVVPKDIVHAINYGTDEEAEKAVAQLIEMGRTKEDATPEKIEEIVRQTVQKATKEQDIVTKFHAPKDSGGFADLVEDPYLKLMAVNKVNDLLECGEPNEWDTYKKAGESVRAWIDNFRTPKQESSFDDKREKKKTIDTVKAATASKTGADTTEKKLTASEVIAEMAKSRPGGGS